jgi:hypothetical protein
VTALPDEAVQERLWDEAEERSELPAVLPARQAAAYLGRTAPLAPAKEDAAALPAERSATAGEGPKESDRVEFRPKESGAREAKADAVAEAASTALRAGAARAPME